MRSLGLSYPARGLRGRFLSILVALTLTVVALPVVALPVVASAGKGHEKGECHRARHAHHGLHRGLDKLTVMTRNLYLGADIMHVLEAAQANPDDPTAIPVAVAELFQTVQYTNFPERAKALAREVSQSRPDVIALQEVSTWLIQPEGDFLAGNPQPASQVVYDFLSILQAALQEEGLDYRVAAVVTNADIELPMFAGFDESGAPIMSDLRLVDHDAVLVAPGVEYHDVITGNYENCIRIELGGVPVEFTRGYVVMEVEKAGASYLVANTHLEVGGEPGSPFALIQAAQMVELLSILSDRTEGDQPVILLGDFNSSPYDPAGQPYSQALAAGFLDAWDQSIHLDPEGYTCCYNETLDDWTATLTTRIDHVFVQPGERQVVKMMARRTGVNLWSLRHTGLWPSDHAGVVAKIVLEKDD